MNTVLRLALPKGHLSVQTIKAMTEIGYKIVFETNSLVCKVSNFPMIIYLIRQSDALNLLNEDYCDLVIIGSDYIEEQAPQLQLGMNEIIHLNYCKIRLSIAVSKPKHFKNIFDLEGKKIATRFPNILTRFLNQSNVNSSIYVLGGSVELAPAMRVADAICDIIATGQTINAHGLTEVLEIQKIQPVLLHKLSPKSSFKHALLKEFIDLLLQVKQ